MIKSSAVSDIPALLQKKTFNEFFAGIGLVRAGLERQGWSVAFANDIDPQKYAMYKGHFENADAHFQLGDIHKLRVDRIPEATLATASFPCSDLSLAGGRDGLQGKHSSAFWGFIHVLQQLGLSKPPLVMLENVTGFLSSNDGEDFRQGMLALNHLGYHVDAFVLDAVHFVPHSRQRLFVVGLLEDIFDVQDKNYELLPYESDMRPKALSHYILKHPEIRWYVRYLPSQATSTVRLEAILEELPEDAPDWWSTKRAEYLLNQMSARHREIADRMIAGQEWTYGTVFRRTRNGKSTAELRTDGVAGCLRTPKGGSAKQILFKAGKGKYFVRLITPREAAKLMGIDDYKISVSFDQALFGFGDAVCVPVIEWIAENYLNPVVNEALQKNLTNFALQGAQM